MAAETEVWAHCDNCRFEFTSRPVLRGGRTYCCEGCAIGGPCCC